MEQIMLIFVVLLFSEDCVSGANLTCAPASAVNLHQQNECRCKCTCNDGENETFSCTVKNQGKETAVGHFPPEIITWLILGGVFTLLAVILIVVAVACLRLTKKRRKPVRRCSKTRRDTETTTTTAVGSIADIAASQGTLYASGRSASLPTVAGFRRTRSCNAISQRPRYFTESVSSYDITSMAHALPQRNVQPTPGLLGGGAGSIPSDNQTLSVESLSTAYPHWTAAHQTQPKRIYPQLATNAGYGSRTPVGNSRCSSRAHDSTDVHQTQRKTASATLGSEVTHQKDRNGASGGFEHLMVYNMSDYDSCQSLDTIPRPSYSSLTAVKVPRAGEMSDV